MTEYQRGQMVQHRGSGYIADATTSGEPGVDPAWRLLARGVPAPTHEGFVLTVQGGAWVQAEPTGTDPDPASETEAGVVELATAVEASAGTDTTRAVTPAGLAAALSASGTSFNLADAWAGDWVQP